MKNTLRPALFLILLAVFSIAGAEDPEGLSIGDRAPDFSLKAIDGRTYVLSDFDEARLLMLIFTANHCPTAQAYEERMIALASDYEPGELQLVAVSSNHPRAVCLEELGYSDLGDSFEDMQIRAADMAYNFPYLYDGDEQALAKACGAKATPHVFLFDRERRLRYSGRIDDTEDPYVTPGRRDAREAIEALLAGLPVEVEQTRAFGCSMKWKSKMEWRETLDQRWSEKPVTLDEVDVSGVAELLSNSGTKYRLLNIWATWCGPCIIEFPELVDMQRMYGKRDFELISLSMDRPSAADRVLDFLKEEEAAFANYHFTGTDRDALVEAVDPDWQGNLPYTLLIAPGGEVLYRHDGIIDPLEVKKVVVGQLGRYFADDK